MEKSLQVSLGGCTVFNVIKIIMNKTFLSTFVCLLSIKSFAQNDIEDVDFWIKPSVCVLSESEKNCEDSVDIIWRAKKALSVCLWHDFANAINDEQAILLNCWSEASEGRHTVNISTETSLIFFLKEDQKESYLVSQTFKVIQDTQRYRRRHRNPWSFF